jgi:hypothetical protein
MKTSIGTLLALSAIFCSLTGCQSRSPEPASTNKLAVISGHLPYNPLAWKAITTSTTPHEGTMSTLYGNDTAVAHARAGVDGPYPQGSVLAVVTWKQRDDPHWFGATIPSHPQSVEFLTISSTPEAPPVYERYQGSPLARIENIDAQTVQKRVVSILSERAAVMP